MARCRRFVFLLIGVVTCLLIGVQVGLDGWAAIQVPHRVTHNRQKLSDVRAVVKAQLSTVQSIEAFKRKEVTDVRVRVTTLSTVSTIELELLNSTEKTINKSCNASTVCTTTTNVSTTREILKIKSLGSKTEHSIKGTARLITINPNSQISLPSSKPKSNGGGILSPEQMLRILGNTIAALPVVPPDKVIRILVVTYFRSGSTFLGDVLQQNWKTFYHFEPLHYMSDGLRLKPNQTEEALDLINDIFRCNFSAPLSPKYLKWAEDQKHMFLFKRNRFLWIACRMQPQTCFRPDFANYVCQRAPVQVMKVTRLHMDHVLRLVQENPDLDIRVVHLIRDPRGTISSRKVLEWCNTTSCSDFRVLCNEMNADYDAFQKMSSFKENRFFRVRYEDVSLRPEPVIKQLFSKLGLPYTQSVVKFLRINTRARAVDSKDPYSTRRDSSKTAFEWRKKISLPEIRKIQIGCSRVLKNYQYGFVKKANQLKGDPPLLPFKN